MTMVLIVLFVPMTRMFLKSILLLAAVLGTNSAIAQELVIAGPFGKPQMVRDESGAWQQAIVVYSDPDVEQVIPDITTRGWIQWNVEQFRNTGVYRVYVYSHYKNDRTCRREWIPSGHSNDPEWLDMCGSLRYQRRYLEVNTRNKTVTVLETILMEQGARYNPAYKRLGRWTFPFSRAAGLTRAVARVNSIVESEMRNYRGPSAQDQLQQERDEAARMAAQAYGSSQPQPPQGCNATPEELKNWHSTGCPPTKSQPANNPR
jgi:hypothetical protein